MLWPCEKGKVVMVIVPKIATPILALGNHRLMC